jgi:hypothetical protein
VTGAVTGDVLTDSVGNVIRNMNGDFLTDDDEDLDEDVAGDGLALMTVTLE